MAQLFIVVGVIAVVLAVGWTVIGLVDIKFSGDIFRAAGLAFSLGIVLLLAGGMLLGATG